MTHSLGIRSIVKLGAWLGLVVLPVFFYIAWTMFQENPLLTFAAVGPYAIAWFSILFILAGTPKVREKRKRRRRHKKR